MAKTAGMGDQFYIAGYDVSGDVGSVDQIGGGPRLADVTAINESAHERITLTNDGRMSFTTFFNNAALHEHAALSTLPTADVIAMYLRGSTVGNPAAALNAKQVNYDPTRSNTGELTFKCDLQANKFGLEWGKNLTAGLRSDTTATTGTAFDDGAGTSFGGQAYFMLTAFAGTSVTIDIQSCTTSGGVYATTGLTTSAMTAIGAQRVAIANNVTINEFLKVVTTGTFTSAKFVVVFVRNAKAVTF